MRGIRWFSLLAIVLVLLMESPSFGGRGVAVAQAAPPAYQANGQICVLAFDDQNGNGVREADEPLLSGIGFTLVDASGVKGSYSTDGNTEPYCFGNLAPGAYTVQARGPANVEVTTVGQWAIGLSSGAQFDVAYGIRRSGDAGASNKPGTKLVIGQRPLGTGAHRTGRAGRHHSGRRRLHGLHARTARPSRLIVDRLTCTCGAVFRSFLLHVSSRSSPWDAARSLQHATASERSTGSF